jgi:flagellar basal body-associated protein FliL
MKKWLKWLIWIIVLLILMAIAYSVYYWFFILNQESKPIVCAQEYYDCDDFKKQVSAQIIYDYCVYYGVDVELIDENTPRKDIHGLDSDGDRIACEGLK